MHPLDARRIAAPPTVTALGGDWVIGGDERRSGSDDPRRARFALFSRPPRAFCVEPGPEATRTSRSPIRGPHRAQLPSRVARHRSWLPCSRVLAFGRGQRVGQLLCPIPACDAGRTPARHRPASRGGDKGAERIGSESLSLGPPPLAREATRGRSAEGVRERGGIRLTHLPGRLQQNRSEHSPISWTSASRTRCSSSERSSYLT